MQTFRLFFFVFLFSIFCTEIVHAQWVQTSGPENVWVNCFAVNGSNLFVGTQGGVFLTTDNGTNWTAVNNGFTVILPVEALEVSGGNLFAGTWGGVYLSTDNGTNWTAANNGIPDYTLVYSFAVIGSNLFAGTHGGAAGTWGGMFLSTDNGTNWTAINNGLPYNGVYYPAVPSLAVNGSNLFAGTGGNGVFLSTDNGTSWTSVSNGLPYNGFGYPSVDALEVSGSNLFAGIFNNGVYRSTNNGTNWIAVNNGLEDFFSVKSFAVSGSNIFAEARDFGVYSTDNDGTNWTNIGSGLTTSGLSSLAVSGSYLYLGTFGLGVWRRPLSEITAVEEVPNILPSFFVLKQNYPNPFNPSTSIEYSIPSESFVELKVYDILGNEVASLVNEQQQAGVYRADFTASNLSSGIYFYRLQAGSFIETKKMILLR